MPLRLFFLVGLFASTVVAKPPFYVTSPGAGMSTRPGETIVVDWENGEEDGAIVKLLSGPNDTPTGYYFKISDGAEGAARWTIPSGLPSGSYKLQFKYDDDEGETAYSYSPLFNVVGDHGKQSDDDVSKVDTQPPVDAGAQAGAVANAGAGTHAGKESHSESENDEHSGAKAHKQTEEHASAETGSHSGKEHSKSGAHNQTETSESGNEHPKSDSPSGTGSHSKSEGHSGAGAGAGVNTVANTTVSKPHVDNTSSASPAKSTTFVPVLASPSPVPLPQPSDALTLGGIAPNNVFALHTNGVSRPHQYNTVTLLVPTVLAIILAGLFSTF